MVVVDELVVEEVALDVEVGLGEAAAVTVVDVTVGAVTVVDVTVLAGTVGGVALVETDLAPAGLVSETFGIDDVAPAHPASSTDRTTRMKTALQATRTRLLRATEEQAGIRRG